MIPVRTIQKLEPAELKLLYTKGSIFADQIPMTFVLNVGQINWVALNFFVTQTSVGFDWGSKVPFV
jgi:hypothetical protein